MAVDQAKEAAAGGPPGRDFRKPARAVFPEDSGIDVEVLPSLDMLATHGCAIRMEFEEREELKEAARSLIRLAKSDSQRRKGYLMLIEGYYLRNPDAPDFETYASNWLEASRHDLGFKVSAMLRTGFPTCTLPRIQVGYSDWNSFGKATYPLRNRNQ